MFVDYVQNGQGFGQVGSALQECRFDTNLMRPYVDNRGRHCITVNTGRKDAQGRIVYQKQLLSEFMRNSGMVVNGPASLRKEEWIQLDNVVLKAARNRLRAWGDLAAANTYSGFNGMSKMMLEYETMSDPGEAFVDMDTLTEGRNDRVDYQLEGLPLPITHTGFWFSSRKLAISRNGNMPLDTVMGEAAGRRIGEKIEDTLIGIQTGMVGQQDTRYSRAARVWGYTTFPDRITKTDLTTPTGANPNAVVQDVIEMRELAYDSKMYGPFVLYHTPAYDAFFDADYAFVNGTNWAASPSGTLRDRLNRIDGITGVRRLDRWTGSPYQMILVQMTPDVARAVIGMDLTTVQWQTMGGMRINFKTMCIMVPQLRADYYGNCGIVHGTTS